MLAESELMKIRKTNYLERLRLEARQIENEKAAINRIPPDSRINDHVCRLRRIDERTIEINRMVAKLQYQIQLYDVRIEGQKNNIRSFIGN